MKEQIKLRFQKNKKVWYTVFAVVILMMAFSTRVIVELCLKDDVKITDVFLKNSMPDRTSTLEVAGEYGNLPLSLQQKEQMVRKVADAIGLEVGDGITHTKQDSVSEVSVKRTSQAAETAIKLVSVDTLKDGKVMGTNHYLLVKLQIFRKIQSVLDYKQLVEKCFQKMGIIDPQSTVAFTGKFPGKMTVKQKNQVADRMIGQLGGNVTYENRANDLYTVYAYTGNLNDYVQVADSKVNIQVAMNYDELTNQTVVYLASPLLNESY